MTNGELVTKAEKLRVALDQAIKEKRTGMPVYAKAYHKWFALREEGLKRGVFKFFIPSENDSKGGNES